MNTSYDVHPPKQAHEGTDPFTLALLIVVILKATILLYFIALTIPALEGLMGATGEERVRSLSICLLVVHIVCAELAYRANSRFVWAWYLLLFGVILTMVNL